MFLLFALFHLFMFAVHFVTVGGGDVCRQVHFLEAIADKALSGHVVKTIPVETDGQCEVACYDDLMCLSYNIGPKQADRHQCELSKSDHIRDPGNLVPMAGYTYRPTENRCSSSPCSDNATCLSLTETIFQCLCPAGFTGNSCETDIDECQTNQYICPVNEECINTAGSYVCNCVSGVFDDAGVCQLRTGTNCKEIKTAFPSAPDGMYEIQPNNGLSKFWAYCDMTLFGGGWTMCYSTDNLARPKTEVTYDENHPYGTDGYRTDCNNIQFREILFVDETTNETAFFTYKLNSSLLATENYGTQISGLWLGGGVATKSYEYQLRMCDHSFYSGFFISGFKNCYKKCYRWCSDHVSPYFRSASTHPSFAGVAFNVNGHRPLGSRLISVGLR
ncbi:uncharacterized protein LOC111341579 [Stylophora pistillata]|uniref:uncharacterized protein LOC111341579 n=1 Tax=Stylophora pistillata TaxID=50429 RepID=UPI000C055345|nr:uncharacterized protein LOC111341579 [Stylophora pistillata]